MPALERLKKHKTIPYIDVDKTKSGVYDWARIGKSTVFDLTMNAETEENDFIEDENPTTDLMYYKPELDSELQCNKGDEAFDFLYDMFIEMPTGEDVKCNTLLVFAGNVGSSSEPKFKAWFSYATITIDHFDTVAEKIYFKINFNAIKKGTATVTDGVPTFVEA